ncbi:MAG: response regulator [Actinomycetes bacterium]
MTDADIAVLVVDDEPLIAQAHEAYVGRVAGFAVVGVVHSGRDALRFVQGAPVDLVLLDFNLPDVTGLDVCRTLRGRGLDVDVIAVTSARDVDVVRAAVSLGVVQYLLKPFAFSSFRDKLERYAEYRRHIGADVGAAAQADVDRALRSLRGSEQAALPKGLSPETLHAVVEALRGADAPVTSTALGSALGVSRVTVRRYLEHLVDAGSVQRAPRYGRAGRPEYDYSWRGHHP